MKFPIKMIGKYVGRAVGREAGIIPDTTQFEITPEQRADLVQIVAEGTYAALAQFAADEAERERKAAQ